VMVVSTAENHARRAALRRMWASQANLRTFDAAVIFVLSGGGESMTTDTRERLEAEQKAHGDLLLISLVESYQNLTLKVCCFFLVEFSCRIHNLYSQTLALFTYALTHCRSTFVAKTDDDVMLNLEHASTNGRAITGVCYNNAPVHRDVGDKWWAGYGSCSTLIGQVRGAHDVCARPLAGVLHGRLLPGAVGAARGARLPRARLAARAHRGRLRVGHPRREGARARRLGRPIPQLVRVSSMPIYANHE